MRTLLAALLPVLAAALVACGGSTERPVVGAGTSSTTTSPTTTPTTTSADDAGRTTRAERGARKARGAREAAARGCAELGITVPPFNEGACVEDGVRFVVANGRSLMRLRSMDVAIREFSVVDILRSGGEQLTPQGIFLLVKLAVRNRTDEPQRFAPGQTLLAFEQQRLQEHTGAEERFLPGALAHRSHKPIAPDTAVEGAVVYDVPLGDVDRITREGQLLIANFDGIRGRYGPEVGQFRIGVR